MTDESTQTGPKAGAKLCSRLAMAFSSAWIAVLTVCKGAGLIKQDVDEIIVSGAAIVEDWCEYTVSEVLSSRRKKGKIYKAFRNMFKSERTSKTS